jgi:hypothetical protein
MYATLYLLAILGAAPFDDPVSAKAALETFNEFVGEWKGSGAPDKPRADPKEAWSETGQWSWRFKGSFNENPEKYIKEAEERKKKR